MSDRPNILFITTDHLRYDTLGYTGDPVIKTPNIDELASDSVNFSNYYRHLDSIEDFKHPTY